MPRAHLAAGKRGRKRGLIGRPRTVLLMLDETIITETPPLSSCYGRLGQQVRIPIRPSNGTESYATQSPRPSQPYFTRRMYFHAVPYPSPSCFPT